MWGKMFGRGNILSQWCHILCKSEILLRGSIFKRFPQVKNAAKIKHLCHFGDFAENSKSLTNFQDSEDVLKILYLHWVEGTPQLCQIHSVMKSEWVKVCLPSWVIVSGLGAPPICCFLASTPWSWWHKATGGLQPSWIIGDCVRRLSLPLLVSPWLHKHPCYLLCSSLSNVC